MKVKLLILLAASLVICRFASAQGVVTFTFVQTSTAFGDNTIGADNLLHINLSGQDTIFGYAGNWSVNTSEGVFGITADQEGGEDGLGVYSFNLDNINGPLADQDYLASILTAPAVGIFTDRSSAALTGMDDGSIVDLALNAQGTFGLYVAPVPEPTTNSFFFLTAALCMFSRRRIFTTLLSGQSAQQQSLPLSRG